MKYFSRALGQLAPKRGPNISNSTIARLLPNTDFFRAVCIAALATVGSLLFYPTKAIAECRSGASPSYDDITAVLLTDRYRRGETITSSPRTSLLASSYCLFFWNDPARGIDDPPVYSQFNLVNAVGTYHPNVTMADVRRLLQKDNFYSLSPKPVIVTDGGYFVLSVLHCAVVTRIARVYLPNDPPKLDQDPAVEKLIEDLQAMLEGATKTKVSDRPTAFEYDLIFNP